MAAGTPVPDDLTAGNAADNIDALRGRLAFLKSQIVELEKQKMLLSDNLASPDRAIASAAARIAADLDKQLAPLTEERDEVAERLDRWKKQTKRMGLE